MVTARSTHRGRFAAASLLAATALVVTGCASGEPEEEATEAASDNKPVTISVATSQPEETPNYFCGVELLKDRLEAADIPAEHGCGACSTRRDTALRTDRIRRESALPQDPICKRGRRRSRPG